MKFITTILIFSSLCISIFAENMKIALLSGDRYDITESAILKGAKDYAKRANVRYNANIEVEILQAKFGEALKEQILELKNDKTNSIIISIKDSLLPKDFNDFLAEVSKDKFNIALINTAKDFNNALVSSSRDRLKEIELIKDFIDTRKSKFSYTNIFLFKSDDTKDITKDQANTLISHIFNQEEFDKLCSTYKHNIFFKSNTLSDLYKDKKESIARLDNHGIIIANREVLADFHPIPHDNDRRLIISLETNALAISYMQENILSASIAQDFFGYGFLACKALIEKYYENINPTQKNINIAPRIYTQENLNELKELAQSWLN